MQHERQHVPVTALALVGDDWIFSGQGPYLHIYGSDGTAEQKIRVFDGQAIHGIVLSSDELPSAALIWGGSLARSLFVDIKDGRIEVFLGPIQNVQDWILDAAFAPSSHSLIGLVTAHNALATISIARPAQASSPPPPSLHQRVPGSNCILYSAHISWLSPSHCLVASGTAFGDIIVWSAYLEHDSTAPSRSRTHFTFAAHEGSVFGVRLSPQLNIPGFGCERVLASCSDDRTIRIWDVSDLPIKSVTTRVPHRDTGFGSKVSTDALAPPCLAKAMGHISRIWHVRYAAAKHPDETMRILSFGEDASVIIWALQAHDHPCSLTQLHSIKAHSGKNIWAVASDERRGLLATGAADGAIALYGSPGKGLDVQEIPAPISLERKGNDAYRTYGFVGPSTVLATTDRGSVVHFHPSGESLDPIEVSPPLPTLRGYSIISTANSSGFIGGSDGTIYVFDLETAQLVELAQIGSKVAGLFASRCGSDLKALLATTVNATEAQLLLFDGSDQHRSPARAMILSLPESFVVTSFAYYEEDSLRYAVIGSRGGAIAVYRPSSNDSNPLDCSVTISEAHGTESVTALRLVQRTRTAEHAAKHFLFSTGRDGTFAVRELRHSEGAVKVITLHQLALPYGPNIEGLKVHDDYNSSVWTWGFQSKHFIVYDVIAQREIMRVECGGAHRQWAFEPDFNANGGRFVWTKAGRLFHAQQTSLPFRLLNEGGHGREIKAVAVSLPSAEIGRIVATGAEDTNIKLFRYEKSGGFHCLQTLRKHNTGIQHLAWHGNYLFSSGGFEEFFVWRVSADVPCLSIGVVCDSAHPRSGASDLRIMGFCVAEDGQRGLLRITMAYSDSTLKVWTYQSEPPTWKLISAGDYLTSCLTQVLTTNNNRFITAATDGYLTSWMHPYPCEEPQQQGLPWLSRHKVHQSAIHAIAHLALADVTSLLVTSGDDNAIAITRCTPGDTIKDTDMVTLLIPRAHAAAVTGVAAIPIRSNGGQCQRVQLVSAGIDQRVKVWEVEVEATGAMRVNKVADVFTSVADVSGLEIWRAVDEEDGVGGVLVCGVGMDLWRVSLARA